MQVSLSNGVRLVLGPWLQHGAESPKVCCSIWQGKHLILHQKQHSLTSQLSKAKYFPFLQDCCRCSSCISRPASLMLLTCHSQAKLVGWLSTRCHLWCIRVVPSQSCPHMLFCVACVQEVHICWPWWRGLGMTVTVSGMNVTGKTRALPKVNLAIDQRLLWESNDGADFYGSLQAVERDVAASIQQKTAKAVKAARLKAVDSILWGQKTSRSPSEQYFCSVLASLNGTTHAACESSGECCMAGAGVRWHDTCCL